MFRLFLVAGICALAGCGSADYEHAKQADTAHYAPATAERVSGILSDVDLEDGSFETALAQADGEPPAVQTASVARRIIYNATVSLVVDEFETTGKKLPELIEQHDGYLAEMTLGRAAGTQRTGRWVVRVPVGKFDSFVNRLSELGYPENRSQTSQDVTDQYVDLEARIANNKRLEQRVLKLLEERNGKIGEVIEVERELARIRQQIEQMEGKLRQLASLSSFSTVTINVREELNYTPPEAPTFAARAGTGWSGSIRALVDAAQGVAIFAVVAFPWLLTLAVIAAPPVWLLRRSLRRSAEHRQAIRAAAGKTDPPADA